MSIRRPRPLTKGRLRQRGKKRKALAQVGQRKMLLEKLEDRRLLAGAQFIGIQPSDGEMLDFDGLTLLDVAPSDLTLLFDEGQQFPAKPDGIRISRAGEDMLLGTNDDVIVQPSFLGPKESPNGNEIVARFASTLVNDLYRVEIFSQDIPVEGISAFRNINGEALVTDDGDRVTVDFRVAVAPTDKPFQNPRNRLDVNSDTLVTPFDLLLVLTHIQTKGSTLPETPPPPYVDVDGSNAITTADLRLILEVLNDPDGQGEGEPQAEGEGGGSAVADSVALLTEPLNVSRQHSSLADLTLASNTSGIVTMDDAKSPIETLPAISSVTSDDSIHLLRGAEDDTDDLDSYLDAIAVDAKDRLQQRAIDEALVDLLLED